MCIRDRKKWTDEQTPSAISIIEMEFLEKGSPTILTRYIQARRIKFVHNGIELEVHLSSKDLSNKGGIDLRWGSPDHGTNNIAMIPKSYQNIELVAKENMR